MNAIYLHLPDGTPTNWSMCSECRSVAAPGNYDLSEKCCTCYDCGKPLPKDERIPYADGKGKSLYHRECKRQRRIKRMAEQMEAAELLPAYDDPVYCEGRSGSYGDGYFADVDELAEDWDMDDDQSGRPEFAFCCTEIPFSGVKVGHLLESLCADMDEDAQDRLEGVEDLDKACEAFNKLNAGVCSWYEDRKHKVAVPPMDKS